MRMVVAKREEGEEGKEGEERGGPLLHLHLLSLHLLLLLLLLLLPLLLLLHVDEGSSRSPGIEPCANGSEAEAAEGGVVQVRDHLHPHLLLPEDVLHVGEAEAGQEGLLLPVVGDQQADVGQSQQHQAGHPQRRHFWKLKKFISF